MSSRRLEEENQNRMAARIALLEDNLETCMSLLLSEQIRNLYETSVSLIEDKKRVVTAHNVALGQLGLPLIDPVLYGIESDEMIERRNEITSLRKKAEELLAEAETLEESI